MKTAELEDSLTVKAGRESKLPEEITKNKRFVPAEWSHDTSRFKRDGLIFRGSLCGALIYEVDYRDRVSA